MAGSAILTRRSFLGGLALLVAAPAIVRATSIMPVKAFGPEFVWVPGQDLEDALGGIDFNRTYYGDMFMMMKAEADRLMVRTLDQREVYRAGLAEWRFPKIMYAEEDKPPTSWE